MLALPVTQKSMSKMTAAISRDCATVTGNLCPLGIESSVADV